MCCIYKVFRQVQGRLLLEKHFKSQYKLLPFGASCNLVAKMHNTSKFWSVRFMASNSFIILFMIDLYKDNHVCVSINFFFKKLLLRNY